MARNLAFVIGVADAKPCDYVGGAVNSAKSFAQWSMTMGYQTVLITDEPDSETGADNPVTIARLRGSLETALNAAKGPVHRVILYFAGHGLIREAEEGLWLLSDCSSELRAVVIEPLKRRLLMWPVDQISIIADACRSLPPTIDAADLVPDPVLGAGPAKRGNPAIDRFIAAQDGNRAYVIPGQDPSEDRCLFSCVLLEGLWGTQDTAFSRLQPDYVTSQSLGTYLLQEVPKRAATFNVTLTPIVSPSFPELDDYYFQKTAGTVTPTLPLWPNAASVAGLKIGSLDGKLAVYDISKSVWPSEPNDSLRPLRPRYFKPGDTAFNAQWSTPTGFRVAGNTFVTAIHSHGDVKLEADPNRERAWRLTSDYPEPATPLMIELGDGRFCAPALMRDFLTIITLDNRGVAGMVYRTRDGEQADIATDQALRALDEGALRAGDVPGLVAELRRYKHANPVLGVISAYLYDSVGDIDSIRRMAYFYCQHGPAIPYDIALLGELTGPADPRGMTVTVPPTPAVVARPARDDLPDWLFQATPAASGPVAGLWPWMRQGWAFLDDPVDQASPLVLPGLAALRDHLLPGRFTTLDRAGALELVDLAGLHWITRP